jgi:hypothetical protein
MAFVFLDKKNVIIGGIALAVMFSLGVIIGYFGKSNSTPWLEANPVLKPWSMKLWLISLKVKRIW